MVYVAVVDSLASAINMILCSDKRNYMLCLDDNENLWGKNKRANERE